MFIPEQLADAAIEKGYTKESNYQEALSILKRTHREDLALTTGPEDPPVKYAVAAVVAVSCLPVFSNSIWTTHWFILILSHG